MSKVKERQKDVKSINTKRNKKPSSVRNAKGNSLTQDVECKLEDTNQVDVHLSQIEEINTDQEDNGLKLFEENILKKLEYTVNGTTKKSSYSDGEEIRKKLQAEKCINEDSLQNIKLFFADIPSVTDEINFNKKCKLASNYLRIFIDILEVTANNQLEFIVQACDIVLTVHQYVFLHGKLPGLEKFIAMLHHVVKQLYKKQHINSIIVIIKNVIDFLRVATKKKTQFVEDSKRSFCLIHQMCYSLYYKELQKLIQCQNKKQDVTSYFDLRISSLTILIFSGWKENKFIEHLTNFMNNESIVLSRSDMYNKEIIIGSMLELLNTLYDLLESESNKENNELVTPLLHVSWRLAHLYVSFCLKNQLHNDAQLFFPVIPHRLSNITNFSVGIEILLKSVDLINLNDKCICVRKDVEELYQYPLLLNNFFNIHCNKHDLSQMFDVLNLIRINSTQTIMCGCVINIYLEIMSFATSVLLKTSSSEKKKRISTLLNQLRGLVIQISSHLFPDNRNDMQCYGNNAELRCRFETLINDNVVRLYSFICDQRNDIKQEDIKYLAILFKIGVYYYTNKKYMLVLPNLQLTLFLNELQLAEKISDTSYLKDLLQKCNILAECYCKLEKYEECSDVYIRSIRYFGKLSSDELLKNKSLLETQVTHWVKKKLNLYKESSSLSMERLLYDEISQNEENYSLLLLLLEFECDCYKKFSKHNVDILIKRIYMSRKDLYEKNKDMLKYVLCMIEMSTTSTFDRDERFHWCSEAIGLMEEFYKNLQDTNDKFEWHVRDLLAISLFQRSVMQYEEKVFECMKHGEDVVTIDISIDNDDSVEYILEEDYTDEQFIVSLNSALELWIEIAEKSVQGDNNIGDSSFFYDPDGSAKCLYDAAVFYSLLSQNLNSVKASYLSGFIYQMLLRNSDKEEYKEKQVQSWTLTASQFLLIENIESGKKIMQDLHNLTKCSVLSQLHIDLLKAAYFLYSGNIQPSAEIFHDILNNKVLKDNNKSSLIIKSDIYYLLSDLKLITGKEEIDIIFPYEQHFPLKSPFPPMYESLRYLRHLHSKYVEEGVTKGGEIIPSLKWAYLDKLLISLTRHAQLLKQQGSVLEAKTLLNEGLILTKKYHLTLRTVDILQQLASVDIILGDENSFNANLDKVMKIMKPTVQNCFTDSCLAPHFIDHDSGCACNYCIYPKLQEIHVLLYLLYKEGRYRFSQMTNEEYESSIKVIDTLVDNAYKRFITSFKEVYKVTGMSLSGENDPDVLQQTVKKGKKSVTKKKTKAARSQKESHWDDTLSNIFFHYSLEAKINKSISKNQSMIETVEQSIQNVELSIGFQQNHHEYHRLRAQLYVLKSFLYLDRDVVESVWFDRKDSKCSSDANLTTPKTPVTSKRGKKKSSMAKAMDSNLMTDETPRQGKRKGRTLKKGRLNALLDDVDVIKEKSNKSDPNSSKYFDMDKYLMELKNSLPSLNPYTDSLIIKGIYKLLMIFSGTSNKNLTISCQLLSSSRTLHQQILSSYGKKIRDRISSKSQVHKKEMSVLETTSNLIEKNSCPKLVFDDASIQDLIQNHIPHDWCICGLSLAEFENKRYLILCRSQGLKEPTVMKINLVEKLQNNGGSEKDDLAAAFDNADLLEKFDSLVELNQESMKILEKSSWWSERVRLDKEMKLCISRLEDEWLQGWKGLLLGEYVDSELESNRISVANEIIECISSTLNNSVDNILIECLIDGFEYCTKYQILDALQVIFGEDEKDAVYEIFVDCMKRSEYGLFKEGGDEDDVPSGRKPVILILDKTLQRLPWESMSILRNQPVTRMPSFLMTASHCSNYQDLINIGVKIQKCSYILNPRNDLKRTEDKFADWFQSEGWNGVVGRPPTPEEFSDAISSNDLFIYCGHGSGQEYLSWSAINRLQSNAVSLLMGCNSGKLLVQGELEAQGMVLYYLSAGCPVVVANLWHVTDRDIDIFLERFLKLWLTEKQGSNVAECVSIARQECKLRYLNGAAPVVYGIPLFIRDT